MPKHHYFLFVDQINVLLLVSSIAAYFLMKKIMKGGGTNDLATSQAGMLNTLKIRRAFFRTSIISAYCSLIYLDTSHMIELLSQILFSIGFKKERKIY